MFIANSDYGKSKFVVIPVPHEATTTYGKGTRNGPRAILRASEHLEEFDEELGFETDKRAGIHTIKPIRISQLTSRTSKIINDKKIPIILGGEHSISAYAVKAVAAKYRNLSILHFDAHADLRDSFEGSKNNHACAMRRVYEICPNLVQVGLRSISKEEYDFAKGKGQLGKMHWAQKIEMAEKIENQLKNNVYISFDVDAFDPSIMPSTGTPEPGGMFWYEVTDILSRVCTDKNIVGVDVIELSPIKGQNAPDFMVAKLVYKIMGYISNQPHPLPR